MNLTMCFPEGRKRALTLSYDDGVSSDIRMLGLMEKYGIKGTFNIDTGMFAKEDVDYPEDQYGRMSRAQCLKLYQSPNAEVAVHARTHPFLDRLPGAEVMCEVVEDRAEIETMFGVPCRGMAYPFGAVNDQVVDILKNAGIVYSRTTVSTGKFDIPTDWLRLPATCHHNNPRLMELADAFLAETDYCGAKLFYVWGHTYEFVLNRNWEVIEEFFQKVGNHPEVWYATNIEVYDYVKAFNELIFSVGMKSVQNNSCIDVWFRVGAAKNEKDTKLICAKAGQITKIED